MHCAEKGSRFEAAHRTISFLWNCEKGDTMRTPSQWWPGGGVEEGRGGWGGSRPGVPGWSQEAVRGLRPRSASCPGSGSSPREVEGWGEEVRAALGSVPV